MAGSLLHRIVVAIFAMESSEAVPADYLSFQLLFRLPRAMGGLSDLSGLAGAVFSLRLQRHRGDGRICPADFQRRGRRWVIQVETPNDCPQPLQAARLLRSLKIYASLFPKQLLPDEIRTKIARNVQILGLNHCHS